MSPNQLVKKRPSLSKAISWQENQALGGSKGGFSTKVHIRAEGFGKPMIFVVTSGERHDTVPFDQLLQGGVRFVEVRKP